MPWIRIQFGWSHRLWPLLVAWGVLGLLAQLHAAVAPPPVAVTRPDPLPAQGAPTVLRVVTDNNYPPYVFIGADGQAEGYLVDLWQLWQQKTGIPVDFRPMQWSMAVRAVQTGEADVIDLIYRTEPRESVYDFSASYARLPVSIYVDAGIQGVRDARSMKGFAVGVQSGDACVDELTRLGLTRLAAYPNYAAILQAAESGDIKMFCMDDEPANYYLYLKRDSLRFAKAFTLYEGLPHWAVLKGQSALFSRVSQGMALITEAEREALREKWMSHPLQYQPYARLAVTAAVSGALVLLGALLWIGMLRRAVRRHTAELSLTNRNLEAASALLEIERAQLRTIVDSNPDAMALKDPDGVYIDCNAGLQALVGRPREEILGRRDEELIDDPRRVAIIRERDHSALVSGLPVTYELRLAQPDGDIREYEVVKVPIRTGDSPMGRILTQLRDITERRQTERELRIAAVAFESQDGMMITDAEGRIERVNAAFTRITGYSAEQAVGRTPALLKSGVHEPAFYALMWTELRRGGYWSGEIMNRHRLGRLFTARMSITAVTGAQGEVNHYIGHFQDLSAEKHAQAQAEHFKLFDPLTELPNRTLLEELMNRALASSQQQGQFGALVMLDLDRFQQVNDSLGHAVGDQLLLEVSRRLKACLGEGGAVSRFSGDSFVLVLERLGDEAQAVTALTRQRVEALRLSLTEPLQIGPHRLVSSASIGVTLFQGWQVQPDELLRQVELAMYRSKNSGRNTVRFFEAAMQAELARRTWLEDELRQALPEGQLALHYQVQVDVAGQAIGAEALLRWRHPTRGMIPPGEFIALAEDSGLIEPIGQWVLTQACQQLARWAMHPRLRTLSLAINISPRQFKSEHFVANILEALLATGARAEQLKLEVTESLAIDDFEASIAKLRQLQARGFRISLDDFGTGNSSLNYLTKLPLAQLKIDKSFVDELPDDPRDAMVAQTIIAMGQGLGLDVIAEGVETEAQREFLAGLGCHAFQGYLFGRPLPSPGFEQSLEGLPSTEAAA